MTTALARRFKVDLSTIAAPTTWVNLKGINDLNPAISPSLVAADDYDSNGFSSFEKTMQGWVTTAKCRRATNAGVFDPGQELARSAQLQFGDLARLNARWYDRNGAPEAYQGVAIVGYSASKTGVADLDEVTITLTGDGILAPIANPFAAAAVPVILGATPTAIAQGGIVNITGTGFGGVTGAASVKFGATNATSYLVVSDNTIVAVMPAGSAGAANITVINGAGTSTAFSYTRGA
ncbi:phage tail tube protein [Microbacterium allomyrinae]|uniref:IPT/TIG domain-containing protein n=1 Tax=Microbacterium allomyrinae TaxID=2830666 RepID=A0A9X1LVW9_9MICO|nr:IPT/TIG domain-containing protein [Microbacterium allomyrinae]MCC2033067.1 IPT/TIG domain-containing protein [Microbacterium allomyrinae]